MKTEKILIGCLLVTLILIHFTRVSIPEVVIIEFTLIAFNYMPLTVARLLKVRVKEIFTIRAVNVGRIELLISVMFCMSLAFFSIGLMFLSQDFPGARMVIFVAFLIGVFPVVYQLTRLKKWKYFLLNRFLIASVISGLAMTSDGLSNFEFGYETIPWTSFEVSNECTNLSDVDKAFSCAKAYEKNILAVVSDLGDEFTNQQMTDFNGEIYYLIVLRLFSEENRLGLKNGIYVLSQEGIIQDQIPIKSSYPELRKLLRNNK